MREAYFFLLKICVGRNDREIGEGENVKKNLRLRRSARAEFEEAVQGVFDVGQGVGDVCAGELAQQQGGQVAENLLFEFFAEAFTHRLMDEALYRLRLLY